MHGIEQLAQSAAISLISGIWQGFVLAAAVWLCLRLAPRATAALRFWLWTVVLVVVVLLPFLEGLPQTNAVQPAGHPLLQLDPRWSLAVAAIWMALSLVRAGHLAVHALRLWSLRRRAVPVEADAACTAILTGSLRKVTLCSSNEVDRPSVIGFLAPRILVPAWLLRQLTPSELEQIVLHEMEHLRRGDDWLNLLQKLALVLLPLNPILVWVERRLCFERELACDDGVLRRTQAPRAYATCLTTLAERGLDRLDSLDRRALSLALGALGALGSTARQSELARRVHRILRREATLGPFQARALTASVALVLLGGAAGLAHCPQIVSFTAAARPAMAEASVEPVVPSRRAPSSSSSARIEQASFSLTAPPARKTLLKASMPHLSTANPVALTPVAAGPARRVVARKPHHAPAASLERIAAERSISTAQWVVFTAWPDSARPAMALPVVDTSVSGHPVLLPYAAVPTAGGWLIVQL